MKTQQQNPATPLRLLTAAVSAILLSSSGLATAAVLEEVLVTAQKRSESLQDVPVTLQAFSNEALTDFGVTSTQDLQNITPGLVINNTGNQGQTYLRGVGTRFAFSGIEPSVATYIDDRYVSRPSSSLFEFAGSVGFIKNLSNILDTRLIHELPVPLVFVTLILEHGKQRWITLDTTFEAFNRRESAC